MPFAKRPRDPVDLTPKQAALRAVLGWLSGLATVAAVIGLSLAAIGWVLTSAQPLRWVVKNGVLPALAWAGYDDIETSIAEVSGDWVTLGPTRIGQELTFERARVSLNPFSPHFAQAVVWGAAASLAEQEDGWVIAPRPSTSLPQTDPATVYDPSPLPSPLPDRAEAQGWWQAPTRLPVTLMLRDSTLTLNALPLAEGADAPQLHLSLSALEAQGSLGDLWSGERAAGELTARLDSSAAAALGLAPPEVRQDAPLTLDLSGAWQWENQQITLPRPQVTATLGAGFSGVGWAILRPLTLEATPHGAEPDRPMVRILLPDQPGPEAVTTLLPHLHLSIAANQISLDGSAPLEVSALPLDLSGILTFGETVPALVRELNLRFQDTTLSLAGAKITGLQATIDVETDRPQIRATAQVVALPGVLAGKGPLYPLRLSLEAAASTAAEQPLAETPIPFSLRLETATGLPLASAQGESLLVGNSGQARLRLEPLTFAPSGLQPEQILPILGGTVAQTSGRLSGSGRLSWKDGTISPDISLALDKVSLSYGFLSLEEMTGVLRLTGFSPLRSPKGQEIAIARLQAGLPLANALATYHLDGTGGLVIERASLSLANGTISLENSRVQLSPLSGDLPLTVSDLDLAALATYGDLDGLSASGTLSGTIPLRLTNSDILIDHGTLTAQQPGTVRYRPSSPPAALQSGGSIDLLMSALDDFHYKSLTLSLNGAASGDLQAGLHLNGANPALYNGFPIELNLSLSGALSQLVSDTVQTTRVPEHLQKRVEEIMKAPSQ